MTVRNEIKEVVLRAACRVLENTGGDLSKTETKRLHAIIEARIPLYTNRYPILGLLDQIESTADAGHAAAVATNAAINRQPGEPNLGWDERLGKFRTPISDQWRQGIQESAAEATQEHFHNASMFFEQGERAQATEHLCSGIICSIAAIAALMGWPHRDPDDDLRAVVGLESPSHPPPTRLGLPPGPAPHPTGEWTLPAEGESIYKLLQSASQQGQDLNSAFAAAMGQPEDVRTGAYDDAGRTSDEAMLFAMTTVKLADQLGRRLR